MKIRSLYFLALILAFVGLFAACDNPATSDPAPKPTSEYTVRFEANGGSPAPRSQTISQGGKVTEPAAMTRTGYDFGGWYKEAACVNQWNFATNTVTGNITLYAKWDPPLSPITVTGETLNTKLQWLASNAASNTSYVLEVNAEEYLNAHTLSYSGKSNITIRLIGIGNAKIITLYGSGSLFGIGNGVTLILDENIILAGSTNNNAPLVRVNNGNLIMNNGAKITGNTSSGGGGVYVGGGTFTMNGGEISSNTAYSRGGSFTGSYSYGGGVYVGSGTFTMTGGEISDNMGEEEVYIGINSRFEKTGGIITGGYYIDILNSYIGYAVYVHNNDSRFIRYKVTTAGPGDNLRYIFNEPNPPDISGVWDE